MKGIITLCGSTKFKEQFEKVNRRLTWSGWVVLSVGSFHHSEKDRSVAAEIIARKAKLDVLHKEKIAMSQAIVVVNVKGYIGKSTKSEVAYARELGKKVYWYDLEAASNALLYNTPMQALRGIDFDWTALLDETYMEA